METTGAVTGPTNRIEHVKAELVRNLKGAYDLEFEVSPLSMIVHFPHSLFADKDSFQSRSNKVDITTEAQE